MFKPCIAAALAATLSAGTTTAQSGASRLDPLDAGASVPVITYKSSFAGYRAQAEAEVAPWRDSNDAAARAGGWRAYAREAQGTAGDAAAPAPTPAQSAPAGGSKPVHGGHHMHGGGKHAH